MNEKQNELVNNNNIFIMRGLPGSGKNWWAEEQYNIDHIVSADEYFVKHVGESGEYNFDPLKLTEAHAYCHREFLKLLPTLGKSETVAVCNTNIKREEYMPYVMAARAFELTGDIVLVNMECNIETAVERNKHGVPPEKIEDMLEAFEHPRFHHPEQVSIKND